MRLRLESTRGSTVRAHVTGGPRSSTVVIRVNWKMVTSVWTDQRGRASVSVVVPRSPDPTLVEAIAGPQYATAVFTPFA